MILKISLNLFKKNINNKNLLIQFLKNKNKTL
jgi:hypothetical protein